MTTLSSATFQARKNEEWASGWVTTATEVPSPEDQAKPHPFAVQKAIGCINDANQWWAEALDLLLTRLRDEP